MESKRFDSVTRQFGYRTTRRTALGGGLLGLASVVAARGAFAQDSTPEPGPEGQPPTEEDFPDFLFVQTFANGTWTPVAGEDGRFTLALSGSSSQTVYFSDRPERIVGVISNDEFLDALGFTPANPPNAALVAQTDSGEQDVIVIELFNPAYDAAIGTLTYEAQVLASYEGTGLASLAQEHQDSEIPESFSSGSLFIDGCTNGSANCYQIVNNEQVTIGSIDNVGCCFEHQDRLCGLCNDDGTSSYYGMLCNEAFPDQCSYDGNEWDCYADNPTCPGT